jgi:uroporphyrinogen-III synthase
MRILFTRPLPENELQLAESLGLEVTVMPLIGVESMPMEEIIAQSTDFFADISNAQSVVFTSQNAVNALFEESSHRDRIIEILRRKPVYTVGESTADSLDEFGIMARFPDDYNGTTLASMMQNDGVNESVLHFCGNIRREEFRDSMTSAAISVLEIEVYRKSEINADEFLETHSVEKTTFLSAFDGAAFYSPSGVEAFWNQGLNVNFGGIYFAIGQTTASALTEHSVEAHVPRIPTSELLIRLIAKHFNPTSV